MQDDETNTRAAAARNQNSGARPGTTGDEPTDEERVAELSRAARRVVHEPADPRADAFVASLGLAPDPEPTVTRPREPARTRAAAAPSPDTDRILEAISAAATDTDPILQAIAETRAMTQRATRQLEVVTLVLVGLIVVVVLLAAVVLLRSG
ncbi:MAG: hypothetical protein ACJ77N_04770 [Chloroflexota bacterium]|jgi:hypothetical protein